MQMADFTVIVTMALLVTENNFPPLKYIGFSVYLFNITLIVVYHVYNQLNDF